jgi:hypothetical protein
MRQSRVIKVAQPQNHFVIHSSHALSSLSIALPLALRWA